MTRDRRQMACVILVIVSPLPPIQTHPPRPAPPPIHSTCRERPPSCRGLRGDGRRPGGEDKKHTIFTYVIFSLQTIFCRNGILYDFLSSFMKDITKANYVTDDALEHIELIKGSSCSTFQTVFSYSTVFSDKWPVSSEQTKKYLLLPAYSCMHSRFQTKCLCNSTWKCKNHFRYYLCCVSL